MDAAELIESTAAAVAEGYRALDLADASGLLLDTYYDGAPEQLAPMALELREGKVTLPLIHLQQLLELGE